MIDTTEIVSDLLPPELLLLKMVELAEKQIKNNDVHINLHRAKYAAIKHFKEKKTYYEETLKMRELGYTVSNERLKDFLKNPVAKQYEVWMQSDAPQEIERKGIDAYLLDQMLFGNLL